MHHDVQYHRFEKLDPDLRLRILEAALTEFGRLGYEAASMNRVVKEARISKGALFNYFGTKAGLFDYVCRSTLEDVKEQLRTAKDSSLHVPFFERLERIVMAGLKFVRARPLSAAVYYRVIYTGDAPRGNSILDEIQDTSRRFFRHLVEDGIREGELRSDIDSHTSAFMVQSVLDRFLQTYYLQFLKPAVKGADAGTGTGTSDYPVGWIREIRKIFQYGLVNRVRRQEE